MALQTVTYDARDGDGGTYALVVTKDVVNTRETVVEVTLDNSNRNYVTTWTLLVNGQTATGTVPAHQSQTWTGLNQRIDNRDITWSIG